MRLLLLLSALLAALSGAGASARAHQAQAVAVASRVVVAPAARAHAAVLPPAPTTFGRAPLAPVARAAPALPEPRLWMERRRE